MPMILTLAEPERAGTVSWLTAAFSAAGHAWAGLGVPLTQLGTLQGIEPGCFPLTSEGSLVRTQLRPPISPGQDASLAMSGRS